MFWPWVIDARSIRGSELDRHVKGRNRHVELSRRNSAPMGQHARGGYGSKFCGRHHDPLDAGIRARHLKKDLRVSLRMDTLIKGNQTNGETGFLLSSMMRSIGRHRSDLWGKIETTHTWAVERHRNSHRHRRSRILATFQSRLCRGSDCRYFHAPGDRCLDDQGGTEASAKQGSTSRGGMTTPDGDSELPPYPFSTRNR